MSLHDDFNAKFRIPELTVKGYRHWIWSVRPMQATLGASVVSARRYVAHFGEMTSEQTAELAAVVRDLEAGLKAAFAYDKINYLMLMMVDPHVHFHVLPRYASPREFLGRTWVDANWPKPPDVAAGPELTAEQGRALVARILAHPSTGSG
jgi:diadenosine tetraphosphate (Ap4A) HIT family hydrolase